MTTGATPSRSNHLLQEHAGCGNTSPYFSLLGGGGIRLKPVDAEGIPSSAMNQLDLPRLLHDQARNERLSLKGNTLLQKQHSCHGAAREYWTCVCMLPPPSRRPRPGRTRPLHQTIIGGKISRSEGSSGPDWLRRRLRQCALRIPGLICPRLQVPHRGWLSASTERPVWLAHSLPVGHRVWIHIHTLVSQRQQHPASRQRKH